MRRLFSAARTALCAAGLLGLAAASLGGCLSDPAYARMGSSKSAVFGYDDLANPDSSHTIRVVMPIWVSDPNLAYEFWNRRADEICDGRILRKSIHTAVRPTMLHDNHGGMPGPYVLAGLVYCEAPTPVRTLAP